MTSRNTLIGIRAQRGFSLVEVLIALIIMSVGMLGIASLYVTAMQAGRTSLFRHNAVTLAGDVADRMRANPTAIAVYAGAGLDNSCADGITTCSNTEMAAHDIFLWDQQALASLPNGNVTIGINQATTPPVYTVTIIWDEPEQQRNYSFTTPIPTF